MGRDIVTQLSIWRRLAVARRAAGAKATNDAAAVAGGVGRKPFGTGGELRQSGPGEMESDGDHGLVIEAKAEKVRLPRWS